MEPFLLDMALKGAVVLVLTGAVATGFRSISAAARHLVWSVGLAAAAALLVVPLATLHPEPVSRTIDARDPGGVLPIPPSASAGLRKAGRSRHLAPVLTKAAPRAVPRSTSTAVTAPLTEPERHSATPHAIRFKLDRVRPPVTSVSHAAAVRVPASVRLDVGTQTRGDAGTEVCPDSQHGVSEDEGPPTAPSRTTLAAIPRPVVTP